MSRAVAGSSDLSDHSTITNANTPAIWPTMNPATARATCIRVRRLSAVWLAVSAAYLATAGWRWFLILQSCHMTYSDLARIIITTLIAVAASITASRMLSTAWIQDHYRWLRNLKDPHTK